MQRAADVREEPEVVTVLEPAKVAVQIAVAVDVEFGTAAEVQRLIRSEFVDRPGVIDRQSLSGDVETSGSNRNHARP